VDRTLIRNFSITILRGDKIGIIGPNGSGKTTLLNILLGSLYPLRGSVRRGTNLQIAYFDQHRAQLDDDKSVIENVGDGFEHVTVNGRSRHIIGYLEDFLFPSERARSPVKVLSGGERNRALLAKLFTKPSNLLVMDEPTNDLDMDTLDLLEEMLVEYEGTVLIVSHDREFLNNVVTSTIVFEGNGDVKEYVGGYDDWLRQRNPALQEDKDQRDKTDGLEKLRTQRERQRTLSFREKKDLEEMPGRIESLETERDRLYASLADPAFYRQDRNNIPAAKARIEELEKDITSAYERWDLLETIQKASS
jgi:ATP-binding cassette subfamily F protein uup